MNALVAGGDCTAHFIVYIIYVCMNLWYWNYYEQPGVDYVQFSFNRDFAENIFNVMMFFSCTLRILVIYE